VNELDQFVAEQKPGYVPRPYRCKACKFFSANRDLERTILESEALAEGKYTYIASFVNQKGANLLKQNIRSHFLMKHFKENA
jgi:hypothetical protein